MIARQELRAIRAAVSSLSPDQRLVLSNQLESMGPAEFCERHGWSQAKYRKVAQRARARLRELMAARESPVPARAGGRNGKQGPSL